MITDIRRDLGLEDEPGKLPWPRHTTAEWVELCARAAGRPVPPNGATPLHPARCRGKPAPA